MKDIIRSAAEGNRTRGIPGTTEISAIFFDFKTGEMTNAGTARNNRVAHNGCGEKRFARDHMERAATSENRMYAAWNGASRISPSAASSRPRHQASSGG